MEASFRFRLKRAEPSGIDGDPHLAAIAEALRPSLRRLLAVRSALPPHAVRTEDDFLSFALEQVADLSSWLSETIPALQTLHEITNADNPTKSDIRRAASQLERRVDALCAQYSLVNHMRCGPRREDGRQALLGIYEHNIEETVEWLATIIDILDDPSAEIERRGLAGEEVTLTATLSPKFPSTHLKALLSWAQKWAFDEALDEIRWLLRGMSFDDDKPARKEVIDVALGGFRTFLDIFLSSGIERQTRAVDAALDESQEPQELQPLKLLETRDAAYPLAAVSALEGFRFYLRIFHGE